MTTEKDFTEISGASLVARKIIEDVELSIYAHRIFYVKVPQIKQVQISMIEGGYIAN